NKGAEVVRMIHTLLGAERFRAGMDLYFERHDGQAVCVEDFVDAMVSVSGENLSQFQRWYVQAGTPIVTARSEYDTNAQQLKLHFKQECGPTPGQEEKAPFHIPIAVGLVDLNGNDVVLKLSAAGEDLTTQVLSLTNAEQSFTFDNIPNEPVPSLLRHFSAPVNLQYDYSDDQLAHLMAHDSDPFNRWEAGQRLALNVLLRGIQAHRADADADIVPAFTDAVRNILVNSGTDPAFAAEALSLPGPGYIAEQLDEVDPDAIFIVRSKLRQHIAQQLKSELQDTYQANATIEDYSPDADSAGRRAIRNYCLGLLMELKTPKIIEQCVGHLEQANNMTDSIAALSALANCDCPERSQALNAFYDKWRNEPLVLDKWFAVQASSSLEDTFIHVSQLMTHPDFDLTNPNRVRAVIGVFCHGNHRHFNAADGSGYEFAATQVIALDGVNAQIAARLARSFDRWRRFDGPRRSHA
ncbi:MAG: DUF3458 domain-containing protein, partial [Gammaproteobacteria bacterium]